MSGTIEEKITAVVKPLVESMDVSLWGVRFRRGHERAVLQIFVESEDGVSADKCGELMDMISPALDVEDIIAQAYTLEVSSPGLDRILFTLEQAKAYVTNTVRAEMRIPTQGRHSVTGVLEEVSDDGILKITDRVQGLMEISFLNISTVRVVPQFPDKSKKPAKVSS